MTLEGTKLCYALNSAAELNVHHPNVVNHIDALVTANVASWVDRGISFELAPPANHTPKDQGAAKAWI